MKPDLPTSAAGLAVLISSSVLLVFAVVLLLIVLRRKRCSRVCRYCCCCWKNRLPAEQVREYLTMEDLLLQVDDGPAARLADDSQQQDWTVETLVPNILKARVKKRSDSRSDLTTPLL